MTRKKILYFMLVLLFCTMVFPSISAQAKSKKDGKYTIWGFKVKNGRAKKKTSISVRKKKIIIKGTIDSFYRNGKSTTLKKKKRVFIISPKCKYSHERYYPKYTYVKCSKAKFLKLSKLWMNKKGDKDTGIFNGLDMTVKNGKVVNLSIYWSPYDGGY